MLKVRAPEPNSSEQQGADDLPAGTQVRFRPISEIDGQFSDPVPGQANGSAVATDPGAGITELTWLVISR